MTEEKYKGGRPKGEETEQLSSRLPLRHIELLKNYCQKHEVTITVALRRAIEKLVESE